MTNSFADVLIFSVSPVVQRSSIRRLLPSVHPRTPECCEARPRIRITLREAHQHADQPHPARLLRARRERPRSRNATDKRDELAPPHRRLRGSRQGIVASHTCNGKDPPMSALGQKTTFAPRKMPRTLATTLRSTTRS